MRTLCYTAPEKDAGRTVKSVLEEELHISSSLISRLKRREGGIAVNGEKAYTTRRLLPGDRVTARVGDPPPARPLPGCSMALSIVYEDEDLLILNKPAGLAVQPTRDPEEMTL